MVRARERKYIRFGKSLRRKEREEREKKGLGIPMGSVMVLVASQGIYSIWCIFKRVAGGCVYNVSSLLQTFTHELKLLRIAGVSRLCMSFL